MSDQDAIDRDPKTSNETVTREEAIRLGREWLSVWGAFDPEDRPAHIIRSLVAALAATPSPAPSERGTGETADKPEPHSKEWWREVAQGLGAEAFVANRRIEALEAKLAAKQQENYELRTRILKSDGMAWDHEAACFSFDGRHFDTIDDAFAAYQQQHQPAHTEEQ